MRPRLVFLLIGLATCAATLHAASFPPHLRFATLRGERASLHFHEGLESLARRALPLAEEILASYERRYGVHIPRVHIVLSDVDDRPNGQASVLPFPLVFVRAAAPDGSDGFGSHDGWLRLVLTHELAHIVHLEQARALPGFLRKLLGRAPFLFPNGLTPTWMTEGLATLEETDGTAFGRGRSSDTRMILRMASLADDFPGTDRAIRDLDRWPGGQSAYLFGEEFLRYLRRTHGDGVIPELARVHSGRLIPFLDERTAQQVTGASFQQLWEAWRATLRTSFERQAALLESAGLTPSRPLTTRGVRQIGPRISPDGGRVAYTSGRLDRYRAIRVMRLDGSADHEVVTRNGGGALSWTPDGRRLVYDELEVHGRFAYYSDLRSVDVADGSVRRLTRGRRASSPDVALDGDRVVFVERFHDRSELAILHLDGGPVATLTASPPGTEWSGPRWSPDGGWIAAARLSPDGCLDVVLVDPETGQLTPLWADRARDLEPAWTPDGAYLVLRSDRDGISNLYVLRLADRQLRRLTRVLGGAFAPDVGPDGQVVFASYGDRGYDIHLLEPGFAPSRFARLDPAPAFQDRLPAPDPTVVSTDVAARPYRPLPAALPRFWTPWAAKVSGEWRIGVATGGIDPLLRHAWAAAVDHGNVSNRVGFQAVYQYDRWLPTFLFTYSDDPELQQDPQAPAGGQRYTLRTRTGLIRASIPLQRRLRFSQDVSLTWRLERQDPEGTSARVPLQLGGLELAWSLGNARRFPYSISPVEGFRLRLAAEWESPSLGSDVSLGKLSAELRAYHRVFAETDALAVQAGYGTTLGEPGFHRSFAVGGFPGGGLRDLVDTNVALLRGYPDDAFSGRRMAHLNVEYRFPLGHPQAGWGTLPVFVRHVHASVFVDAAHAWNDAFRVRDVKASIGASLGTDLIVSQALPLTLTLGVAHGFAEQGETQLYLRTGLSF